MKILAVESSCDETAVAVVEDGRTVLTDCVASHGGRMLVHDISGDFYNVVGLPIARVARAIQKLS